MRSVLSLGVLILAVVLAANLDAWSRRDASTKIEERTLNVPRTVRVFSCGGKLQPALNGHRPVHQGIWVDDSYYTVDTKLNGLRVVTIPPDGAAPTIDNYDLGTSEDEVLRFVEDLRLVEPGSVLAMGGFRFIGPPPSAPLERFQLLETLFLGLGARSNPWKTRLSSFAYLCVRDAGGFSALAEKYSETRGVLLAMHLDGDLSTYAEQAPLALIDERVDWHVDVARFEGAGGTFKPEFNLDNLLYDAVRTEVRIAEPATLRWELPEGLELGAAESPIWKAHVALLWSADARMLGARFRLMAGDEELGRHVLYRESGVTHTWRHWEVPLGSAAARGLEELVVEIDYLPAPAKLTGPAAVTFVGEPIIQTGAARAF